MSSPTPTTSSDDGTPSPPDTRRRLPVSAVVAATVLATIAAIGVLVALGGSDDAGVADERRSDGTLELTPLEEAPGADTEALDLAFTWPDGTEGTLAEVVEGPTVVNFFASWCPPCIAEMPDFEAVSQDLAGQVTIFGLAVQDRPADAERIVDQTGITYAWARDVRGDIANAVGAVQMPTTFFVADGEVVSLHTGALDADELRALIESELGVGA